MMAIVMSVIPVIMAMIFAVCQSISTESAEKECYNSNNAGNLKKHFFHNYIPVKSYKV